MVTDAGELGVVDLGIRGTKVFVAQIHGQLIGEVEGYTCTAFVGKHAVVVVA